MQWTKQTGQPVPLKIKILKIKNLITELQYETKTSEPQTLNWSRHKREVALTRKQKKVSLITLYMGLEQR